ncbi:MAG: helix-turn-helix transcriptional regulator [Firmicutes bacterium]|nr:helix-turn-helix transcriptional regulator [Bacillota bacterium]
MGLTIAERREIGSKIKTARKKKKLSKEQLAELIGYKVATVTKYEQGFHIPDIGMLLKIAEVLECDISEFSTGNRFKRQDIPNLGENLNCYIDWLQSAQIPVVLSTYKNEDDVESVGISVELDGVLVDVSENIFSLMEMSREHFILLAKQFGKKGKATN